MNHEKRISANLSSSAIWLLLIVLALVMSWVRTSMGVYQAEDLPRDVGIVRWDTQASWLRLVCGRADAEGALIYGPYDTYAAGTYGAVFWLRYIAPAGVVVGQIDVHDARRGQILAAQEISALEGGGTIEPYALRFAIEQASELEFRVWGDGKFLLCVDRVEIESGAAPQ